MSNDIVNIKYKMIIFGAQGVGKTSLVQRFVSDKFEANYDSTLGHNVYEKLINLDKFKISLIIFDFGGQEQFKGLRKKMSEGADTAFLVYDVSDKKTFDELSEWRFELFDVADDIPFIIVGNKIDLVEERRVMKEDAENLSKKFGAISYLETSAKTGEFVNDAFTILTRETLHRHGYFENK